MAPAPLITGANLFRSKIVLLPADIFAINTTPILVVPAMPGKILMPVAVLGRINGQTQAFNPADAGAWLLYGSAWDADKKAWEEVLATLITTPGDGVKNIVQAGDGSLGEFAGVPIYLVADPDDGSFAAGAADAATVVTPGLLYAPGDTGTINSGDNSAEYTILTAGGGGAAATLSVAGGTGYTVGGPFATTVSTGSGDGNLTVNITRITPLGNGTVEIDVIYQPI